MTNKEAIDYLRPVADSTPLVGYGLALNLAINALETVEKLKQELMEASSGERTTPVRIEKKQDKVIDKRKDLATKARTISCQMCGKEVVVHACNAKYCEECKVIARREKAKQYNGHTRVLVSDDTEEMLAFCLNCKRPKCTGQCEDLANIVKRSKA